jgi:hypothetical protein
MRVIIDYKHAKRVIVEQDMLIETLSARIAELEEHNRRLTRQARELEEAVLGGDHDRNG